MMDINGLQVENMKLSIALGEEQDEVLRMQDVIWTCEDVLRKIFDFANRPTLNLHGGSYTYEQIRGWATEGLTKMAAYRRLRMDDRMPSTDYGRLRANEAKNETKRIE